MDQHERYDRQLNMPEFGPEGQHALSGATVALCGVGGLGSAASLYLIAAGIGRLIIIDHGKVELSNLNRQVLYGDADVGASKVRQAEARLKALDLSCQIDARDAHLDTSSAEELLAGADLVVDALDNFEARLAINAACASTPKRPLIHGACEGFEGRLATLMASAESPCLRCLYPEMPAPFTRATPILGATAGLVGAAQAAEAIRVILGTPALDGRLLLLDLARWDLRALHIKQNADCIVCGLAS